MIGSILGALVGFAAGVLLAKRLDPHNDDLPNLLGWTCAIAGAVVGTRLNRLARRK
jgi:drug/metabolite transporter (DMT)-like permease